MTIALPCVAHIKSPACSRPEPLMKTTTQTSCIAPRTFPWSGTVGRLILACGPWVLLLLLGGLLHAAPQDGIAFFRGQPAAQGRVIAILDADHRDAATLDALGQMGLKVTFQSRLVPGLLVMERAIGRGARPAATPPGDPSADLQQLITSLRDTGFFESIEPDYLLKSSGIPAETSLSGGDLWGLSNLGNLGGLKGVDIGATAAWDITSGKSNVVVAVIDSGIQADHPDLAPNIWRNPGEIPGNGIDDDGNGYIDDHAGVDLVHRGSPISDPNGHGTHVSGTIAAAADNGYPALGVAWKSRVLAIRAGDKDGGLPTGLVLEGLEYAATSPARPRVVNASFGGPIFQEAEYRMLSKLSSLGIVVVCAAGNEASNNDQKPHYPSGYRLPNVLSVAALRRDGTLADFSNYGAQSVHVGAPGEAIYSTVPGSAWEEYQGTSMAAPHVSGICALVLSIYPNASVVELRQRILQSIVPLPAIADKLLAGGIARADRALQIGPDGALETDIAPVWARSLVAGRSNLVEISMSDVVPCLGGQLSATIGNGAAVPFQDNGLGPDRVANDGIYTGYLNPPVQGSQTVRLSFAWKGAPYTVERLVNVAGKPSNDDFAAATLINSTSGGAVEGTLLGAGTETSEPGKSGGCSVWYRWTSSSARQAIVAFAQGLESDIQFEVFSGASLASLVTVPAEAFEVQGVKFVGLSNQPNQTLYFRVSSTNTIAGRFKFGIWNASTPSNDARSAAKTIATNVELYIDDADSTRATVDAGEPNHAGVLGGHSLWWKFTAPARGKLTVDTEGSLFDTVVAIYPDGSNASLAANDDASFWGQWSEATAAVAEGDTVFIAVDGFKGASGSVRLRARFVRDSNDSYASATVLRAGTGEYGSNVSATAEPGEPAHDGDRAGASVWYKWTAPSGGKATLTVFPITAGLNLKAAVYAKDGNAVSDVGTYRVNSAADMTTGGGQPLVIRFDAAAGQEYRIAIDGLRRGILWPTWESGIFMLGVDFAPELGLVYRTGFEDGSEALIRPDDASTSGMGGTAVNPISGDYSLRLAPAGSLPGNYFAKLGGLDGYASFETRFSFRYGATTSDSGWGIALLALPLGPDGLANPSVEGAAVSGIGFSTLTGRGDLKAAVGGLVVSTNLPTLAAGVIHSLILEADFAGGFVRAFVNANPSARVPIRLPSANNLIVGPSFTFNAGAGPLDLDNLSVRMLPRRLGTPVPWAVTQPVAATVTAGRTIQLTASFGGSGLMYRWERNGVPISDNERFSGSLTPTLSITPTVADAGNYRLVASNDAGTAVTEAVKVTVVEPVAVDAGRTNILWRRELLFGQIGPGNMVACQQGNLGVLGIDSQTGDNYWALPFSGLNLPTGKSARFLMLSDDGSIALQVRDNSAPQSSEIMYIEDPSDLSSARMLKLPDESDARAVVGDAKGRFLIMYKPGTGSGAFDLVTMKTWVRPGLVFGHGQWLPLTNHAVWRDGEGVAAYDYRTGEVRWRYPFGQLRDRSLFPLVWAGNRTILLPFSGLLVAIDSETGLEKWRKSVDCCYSVGLLDPNAGVMVSRGQSPFQRSYYGFNPQTGDGMTPWLSPSTYAIDFDSYFVTEGGGVIQPYSGGSEIRQDEVAWRVDPQCMIVGVSGSGRVILTDNVGSGRVSAIRGSGFPLSSESPQPGRVGEFIRPGSRGFLDGDLSRKRVGRGWARVKDGRIDGIDVFDPGMGYVAAPRVRLVGGGGSNALAEARIDGTGKVVGIDVIAPGAGYTNGPSVRLQGPDDPIFAMEPSSQTVGMGETVLLTATVGNVTSLQWTKDGLALPGATNATLTISNVQPSRIGDYRMVATGPSGSITSSVASVGIRGVNADLWRGLVGYYRFDGNTADSGAFGSGGVGYGVRYQSDRHGRTGAALLLTNTTTVNSVVISNALFRAGQEDFTVSAWVLLTDPAEANRVGTLFNTWPHPGLAMGFGTPLKPGEMRFSVGTGREWRSVEAYPGIMDWGTPRWRQVVLAKRGSTVRQYANGALVTEGMVASQFEVDCGLLFGSAAVPGLPGSVAYNFYGALDDARVYNRALSDTEVALLHGSELPPLVRMVSQPQSVTALVGDRVTLVAGTTNALGYQWFRDGSPVPGATNETLILGSIRFADAGGYRLVASNVMSSVTSDVAFVDVRSFPTFAVQPSDMEVAPGRPVTLSVSVDAVPAATFQWYRDGIAVPGATGATLSLGNVTPAWMGRYKVVALNAVGSTESHEARVSVTGASAGVWGELRAYLPFSGVVADEGAWQHPVVLRGGMLASDRRGRTNSALVLNGTGDFLELPDHPALRADSYTLALWFNAARRAGAAGAVAFETIVSKGPGGLELSLGTPAPSLGGIRLVPGDGAAWESPGSAYEANRWHHLAAVYDAAGQAVNLYIDGVALGLGKAGAFAPGLATTNGLRFGLRHDGSQGFLGRIDDVRVYGRALGMSDVRALVGLEAAAPLFVEQPADVRRVEGMGAVVTAAVLGERPMSFAWSQAGSATVVRSESLGFAALSRADSGLYKLVVTNAFGTAASRAVTVDVLYKPEWVIEPSDKAVNAGTTVRLVAGVDGNPEPSLQWLKDGRVLPGATNSTLNLGAVQMGDAGLFRLVASNEVGVATSRAIVVAVFHAPVIARQPTGLIVDYGQGFELTVQANANPAPSYQWLRGGVALPGATNASYRVASATVADEGEYAVDVKNGLGTTRSAVAAVTVRRTLPELAGLPARWVVAEGGDVALQATVESVPSAALQWLHEGEILPGETNTSLRIARVRAVEAGRYSLRATNVAGTTVRDVDLVMQDSADSLASALDTGSELVWPLPTTSGWRRQTTVSHDGEDAAQSAPIRGYQSSEMRLPLVGSGSLTFWWRTSCENEWDYAEVLLDGERKGRMTGLRNWAAMRIVVPDGLHTVTWRYVKDGSTDGGLDAAWVDEVQWTPDNGSTQPPWVEVLETSDGALQVRVVGAGQGRVAIESSNDLRGWTEVAVGTVKTGVLRHRLNAGDGVRFFRARPIGP